MTALNLYLERLATKNRLSAVTVSDRRGRLVAGVGVSLPLEDLGRLGSSIVTGSTETHSFEQVTQGADLFVREIHVSGKAFVLSSLGDRVRHLSEATGSIQRILQAA